VSSATNILPPGPSSAGNNAVGCPRPNPVALEVMVSVTGAKASDNSAARDLFSEETTTVLIFQDGAVIRLSAPVNAGQLLFLTNKESHQEVVCQVLHTKNFPGASSYVELKFTEDRSDYWGVAFPEQNSAPEFKAAEQVHAEEITAQALEPAVAPHRAEDVDVLKREVEALRQQLESLQKKQTEDIAAKVLAEAADVRAEQERTAREAAVRDAARTMEALAGDLFKRKEDPMSAQPVTSADPQPAPAPVEAVKPALLMPNAPKDNLEAPRAVVSMSLPVWKIEKSPEEQLLEEEAEADERARAAAAAPGRFIEEKLADESLPKPALDFSQMPKGAALAAASRQRGGLIFSKSTQRLALTTILVLVLAGGAWYGQWWKLLPIGRNAPTATPANVKKSVVSGPASATVPPAPGVATPTPATKNAATVPATNGTSTPSGVATIDAAGSSAAEGKSGETNAANSTLSGAENTEESPRKNARGKPKSDAHETASATAPPSVGTDTAASDAPLVEPKLLKAANPVYPPDAMRSYITGDVKAEVIVEPSGRVRKVNVISGPKALREAAVEALKQYEYSPATQAGKPVEGKTTEIVKFWFNP